MGNKLVDHSDEVGAVLTYTAHGIPVVCDDANHVR